MERYESLGPVGEGSYGTVLKCRHRESGRLVAIKKFMDSDDDETVKKIALREIKLLRQLRHDNLVNLLEVWKRRRRWYLVFEFVDRTLLDDLEQNPNGLDLNLCRQYLFQVLRAADFCHQQNVIHRDIKPENILISQDGVVKLCDFGFARTIASPSEGNVYTDYVATRWYRAPELLVGDIKYGKPVDVWALGCLLIETLTGQPLFPGDSDLDQIYHIVKCFGNLMTHHQELFYRNPVFSGGKLPECSRTVPLQQRFPSVTPTAFDLAQRCLEMDPERRASCSELLEHLFFTQDSFHVRFLEDLNAKIQKEHRENSTLPKITKSQGQEKNKGDEKNYQGKEKKQPEDTNEKVSKEKMEKTKGKQPSKLSKPSQSTINISVPKQPKCGNKGLHNAAPHSTKNKPDKNTGAELKKYSEISKSTKSFNSKSADETKTSKIQKKKTSITVKPKHESSVTPEPRRNLLQNVKNLNYSGPDAEKNTMKERSFSKSETNQEFTKTWSNPNLKVPKLSTTLNSQSLNSSPKPVLDSNISLGPKSSELSNNDSTVVSAPLMLQDSRSYKASPSSEHQTGRVQSDAEQRTSENQNALPQNSKTLQATLTGSKTETNISRSSSKTFNLDLPEQSSAVIIEVSPVHNTAAPPKGISNLNIVKTGCTPKKELTEDKSIRKNHGYLKMNLGTETPTASLLLSLTSSGVPESSEPSFTGLQSTKVTTEGRYTSTPVLNKNLSLGTPVLRTPKVSDKENQEDSAPLSVSIKSLTNPLINQTFIASGSLSNRRNSSDSTSDGKFFKVPHLKQNPSKTGSFSDHMRTPATPKSQRTAFALDVKKKMETKEGNEMTSLSRELTPIMSVNQKASTRSFNLHKIEISDFSGFDLNGSQSSTPPPPPPPSSSSLLLLPPSSQSLIHSHSIFSTNNPTDHLIQGAGFHPGTNSLRCVDKPRHYGGVYDRQVQQFAAGHVTGSATFQASDSSFMSEVSKNKSHVYFPDVRSSTLPELRGREDLSTFYGKNNKGSIKNLRKDKNPVPSSSEVQQQQAVNINTNTPKQ